MIAITGLLLYSGCRPRDPEVPVGSHLQADLVVIFKPGTDGKAVNDFLEHTLPQSRDASGEYRPVIRSLLSVQAHGYAGYALTFQSTTLPADRAIIERNVQRSTIVQCVFRNRIPGTIRAEELMCRAAA